MSADYDVFSGHSVATAHVAGVSAFMLEIDPGLTLSQFLQTLLTAAATASGPDA